MRSDGWTRRVGIALALVTAAACARVERKRLLPWFEVRVSRARDVGPVSLGASTAQPYVRRFGFFWQAIDGCLDGEALGDDAAVVSCHDAFNRGLAILRRGETVPQPACGSYASFSQVVPDRSGVDCTTVAEGKAPVVPTKLRYWRVTPARETTFDTTIAIDGPGRAFVGPVPGFYDDAMRGYFVAATEEWQAPADCALFTTDKGFLVPVAAAPELSRTECTDAGQWSRRAARALRAR